MNRLESSIKRTSEYLQHTKKAMEKHLNSSDKNDGELKEFWISQDTLLDDFLSTIQLLPVRLAAWRSFQSIINPRHIESQSQSIISFMDQKIPFSVARSLVLSPYIISTFSFYESLLEICCKITDYKKITKHSKYRKFLEMFINGQKKAQVNHQLPKTLTGYCGWPVKVSYFIRNKIVHEGTTINRKPLFRGDNLSDGFYLNKEAIDEIMDECESDKIIPDQSRWEKEETHPWFDKSIVTIFEHYHSELDEMFVYLLDWSLSLLADPCQEFYNRIDFSKSVGSAL